MTNGQFTIINHKQLNLFYMIISIEVWKEKMWEKRKYY